MGRVHVTGMHDAQPIVGCAWHESREVVAVIAIGDRMGPFGDGGEAGHGHAVSFRRIHDDRIAHWPVVAGEAAGSKLAKARELSLEVIDPERLEQLLGSTEE